MAYENKACASACFTSFLESEPTFDEKTHKYLIYQQEKCPESGKLHWQGYVELHKTMRYKAIMRSLGGDMAVFARQGTAEQAVEYCKKLDTQVIPFKEFGKRKTDQGKRNDLNTALQCETVRELKEEHPGIYVKYHRGIEKLYAPDTDRDARPVVEILWGDTGTGKTGFAWDSSDKKAYIKDPGTGNWWDGYEQQEHVIIDDFRSKDFPFTVLLKLLDRYPMQVQTKGGFVKFNSPNIWITSPLPPEYWYSDSDENLAQLLRRVTRIRKIVRDREAEPLVGPVRETVIIKEGKAQIIIEDG